ncbi:hypothetical protein BaRGS_00021435 [Batillaria attramentaria]|uniref:Cytochrome P450 n=1 Tax=Batillaria attramentaria TaxID=370345 RepID=A0ABD0KJD5_9CAEN
MYGNTLTFLFAGNETLSTAMSFTLFCLTANADCLAKAQAEVDAKLGKKSVTYETAMELTYLDMCMNEAMRILDREALEDTEIDGYHVAKGTRIVIPVISIHRDPAIWPDPMTFDPERHTPEARATRHPYAFMPFGLGPRNCIGMRLAQLEIRMAIATILQHFTPVLCDKSVGRDMALDVTSCLSVTGVLTVCTVTLLSIWIWKAFRKASMFQRQGIPGPPALPFLLQNHTLMKEPWSENLVMLRDDQWKHVRSQLSPTFSSGKLKRMTVAIQRVVKNLHNHVKSKAETGEEVELKALCRNYAIDVIGGVAFGLQVDCLNDPNDPFKKYVMFPALIPVLRKFGITFPPQSATKFFTGKYNDFLQLLVEAEREGEAQGPVDAEIDHGDQLTTSKQWTRKGLTRDEMYANTLIFLMAGNETVSTVMSFTLFDLAGNPDCLAKAQAEVDAKLGKRQVTYETAMELAYLDMCMNESMRLYPPGFILDREAEEDMEFAGYHVAKGMRMGIPVLSIHRDPAIWPDPMKFDPERHTPEARATRHPFAFLPFGMGPRNCIGMRLAQLEIRMAIATILQHFTPVLCDKSVYPPKLQKLKFESQDGLWVKFQARA